MERHDAGCGGKRQGGLEGDEVDGDDDGRRGWGSRTALCVQRRREEMLRGCSFHSWVVYAVKHVDAKRRAEGMGFAAKDGFARSIFGAWARVARSGGGLDRVGGVVEERRRRRALLWGFAGVLGWGRGRRVWRVAVSRGLKKRELRRGRAAWEAWLGGMAWRRRGRGVLKRLGRRHAVGVALWAMGGWSRAVLLRSRCRAMSIRREVAFARCCLEAWGELSDRCAKGRRRAIESMAHFSDKTLGGKGGCLVAWSGAVLTRKRAREVCEVMMGSGRVRCGRGALLAWKLQVVSAREGGIRKGLGDMLSCARGREGVRIAMIGWRGAVVAARKRAIYTVVVENRARCVATSRLPEF